MRGAAVALLPLLYVPTVACLAMFMIIVILTGAWSALSVSGEIRMQQLQCCREEWEGEEGREGREEDRTAQM